MTLDLIIRLTSIVANLVVIYCSIKISKELVAEREERERRLMRAELLKSDFFEKIEQMQGDYQYEFSTNKKDTPN